MLFIPLLEMYDSYRCNRTTWVFISALLACAHTCTKATFEWIMVPLYYVYHVANKMNKADWYVQMLIWKDVYNILCEKASFQLIFIIQYHSYKINWKCIWAHLNKEKL